MGGIFRIINSLFRSVDNMVTKIPKQTRKEIKGGFFALVFLGCVVGSIIGFISGQNAAQIPGQPLVSSINELFEYSRSKEMRDGDFGTLLESNLINEFQHGELAKAQFRTRESMHQAYDSNIIDPQRSPALSLADMNIPQDLIEGNYRADGTDVNKIKRREPDAISPEGIQADKLSPLPVDENANAVRKIDNEVKSIIPNQIDLSPTPKNENLSPEKSSGDTSTPREKAKPEIPSQIDYSQEIIR